SYGIGGAGDDNQFAGNLIGTDVTGTRAIGNGVGIRLPAGCTNNTIGGTDLGAGNIISGNDDGVDIFSGPGNVVAGNFIGTDVTGTKPLGNSNWGVALRAG